MQSWFVEYRSISLAHISDKFVNVSRRVTSYTVPTDNYLIRILQLKNVEKVYEVNNYSNLETRLFKNTNDQEVSGYICNFTTS